MRLCFFELEVIVTSAWNEWAIQRGTRSLKNREEWRVKLNLTALSFLCTSLRERVDSSNSQKRRSGGGGLKGIRVRAPEFLLLRIGPWFLPTSTREAYSFGKSTNFDLLPTSIGNVRNIANELSTSTVGCSGCSTLKIFATAFLDRCQTRVKYVLGLYKNTRSFPLAHFEHHLCLLEFLQQRDCNSVALCS